MLCYLTGTTPNHANQLAFCNFFSDAVPATKSCLEASSQDDARGVEDDDWVEGFPHSSTDEQPEPEEMLEQLLEEAETLMTASYDAHPESNMESPEDDEEMDEFERVRRRWEDRKKYITINGAIVGLTTAKNGRLLMANIREFVDGAFIQSPLSGPLEQLQQLFRLHLFDTLSHSLLGVYEGHQAKTPSDCPFLIYADLGGPNSRFIASGDEMGYIWIWDVQFQLLLHKIRGHNDTVNAVTWHPSGHFIASGSDDSTIKVWGGASASPKSFIPDMPSFVAI